jgi:hypothetical protein
MEQVGGWGLCRFIHDEGRKTTFGAVLSNSNWWDCSSSTHEDANGQSRTIKSREMETLLDLVEASKGREHNGTELIPPKLETMLTC